MSTSLSMLETVIVTTSFPDQQVLAGDPGKIVEVYTDPYLAYDVEFVNPDGSTRALLTLTPEQVRRLLPTDILTTRQLLVIAWGRGHSPHRVFIPRSRNEVMRPRPSSSSHS